MREIKFRHWLPEFDADTNTYKENYRMYYQAFMYNCDCKNKMQYTGLKDRNGVEIYEGDIVDTPQNGIELVEMFMEHDSYGYRVSWEKGVIIGNIYENPELLEGNK